MGAKRKPNPIPTEDPSTKQPNGEKKFVNLLPIYTIYKQKFRRISEAEFRTMLLRTKSGKKTAKKFCKEFMKAKSMSEEIISFEKNNGFLSLSRFMPLVALLAERAGYRIYPSEVVNLDFNTTQKRFKEKFSFLLVNGFWFLGKVISDSLSEKDQVNRGNMFSFEKGDLGFWWAGVKIMDWYSYICKNVKANNRKCPDSCETFVRRDPVEHRQYTNRAIINMNQHPLYFLSHEDWNNFEDTVNTVRLMPKNAILDDNSFFDDSYSDDISSNFSGCSMAVSPSSNSAVSLLSSRESLRSIMSKESID